MKKTFTFLATLLASVILYAGPNQSRLSISAAGNAEVRVIVDGSRYRSNNGVVMISKLNSGNHAVKVYQVRNDRNSNQRYGNNRSNYQLVYSSNVYVKPQYHVDIVINRFGKAFVDEQQLSQGYYYEEDDDNWGNDDNNNNNNNNYGKREMEAKNFELLKQAIKKESFSDTKLAIAKQVMSNNYFSTAQIKELLGLFSFDDTKLDLAKYAYDYTVDRENYFLLLDAFSFSGSKEDLLKYIKDKK